MKKIIASVMALVLLCALLAGCGSGREDQGGVTVPPGSPIIDPSMAPETEDGIVDDHNGLIGDEGGRSAGEAAGDVTGSDAGIIDGGMADSRSASPAPSADAKR